MGFWDDVFEAFKSDKETELTLGFGKGEQGGEVDQVKQIGEKKPDKHDKGGCGWL